MENELVERLSARYAKLDSQFNDYASDLNEIASFLQPERAKFYNQTSTKNTSAQREKIFDSTPEDAHRILAAALHSILTPAEMTWLVLTLIIGGEETSKDVKVWIDEVVKLMMAKFNSEEGGFHSAAHEFYLDLPGLGTAGFFVDEVDQGQIRFMSLPLNEIRFSENHMGIIDTVYRKFSMTARQIAGKKKWIVPKEVTEALEKEPERKFEVIHAIEPRETKKKNPIQGKDMPLMSAHYMPQTKSLLNESGYQEMPAMVPRWSKDSGEVLGRGIGHQALPDIRVLNEMNRSLLIAGEKVADPITLLPHEGWLGDFKGDGGSTNYYRGTGSIHDKVMTIGSDADLNAFMAVIQQRQASVRKMFMNDQLQPFDKVQMTATEYMGNQNEKMRILGPVASRLQGEFLGPLVKRVFNIMLRNGELPPVPEELNGTPLRVQYVSPISRAQRQTEAESFSKAIQYLAPVVQVAPQVLENFDFDAVARDTQDMFGFPAKYMKAPEQIKKERQAAQQAQQEQMAKVDAAQNLELKQKQKDLNAQPAQQ